MITLLRANGHPDVSRYPMGKVLLEHTLVCKMQRKQLAGAASIFRLALSSVFAGKGKEGDEVRRAFHKFVSEA